MSKRFDSRLVFELQQFIWNGLGKDLEINE